MVLLLILKHFSATVVAWHIVLARLFVYVKAPDDAVQAVLDDLFYFAAPLENLCSRTSWNLKSRGYYYWVGVLLSVDLQLHLVVEPLGVCHCL